jgi:hypothetical protein|tara:strand:+ start:816 stop:3410 length:2595 start_codon:yes stop_codon:yes gene_type:complete
MKTPQEYLEKDFNITPCGNYKDGEYNPKAPKLKEWQKKKATLKDFNGKDNIGIIWDTHFDIDVDNPLAHNFVPLYLKPSSAIYGRDSNKRSHFLFKGKTDDKEFRLPKEFEPWCKSFPHGNTLIEIRSGSGQQSLGPGSKVGDKPGTGEEVKWEVLEGISIYDGEVLEDVSKIAFATAMTILYPSKGNRRDYVYSIACVLAKGTTWTDSEIDRLIEKIATHSGDKVSDKLSVGTHARQQMGVEGARLMGLPTLSDILGVSIKSLGQVFAWIGVEMPDEKLIEIRKDYYYFEDIGEMYDPKTDISFREKEFNNKHLYNFPGTKGKKHDDKAFAKLLKDPEFQERKLQGRAMLPDHEYPVAVVEPGDHPLLTPGRYFNLYEGRPLEPEEGDVSEIIKHFKKVFGEDNWVHLEQYLAYCIKYPGAKTRWIPLVVSVEGVGKGLLMRMMSKLIGIKYVNENVSFKDITEKHSTIVVGTLFICLNEVVLDKQYSSKRTISSQIKPFITDDFLNINEKGKRIYKYLNNCNSIVFSNDKDCLHVDQSSRRYLVIHCKTTTKEIEKMADRGDFDPLWEMLEKNPEYLLDYFINEVKIEDEKVYQKRAPKTPELIEMIEDSKHDTIGELDEALAEKAPPFDEENFRGFISKKMLVNFIRNEWKTPHPPIKLINEWLKDKGLLWKDGMKTRQIVMANGARPRCFLIENKRGILKELSEGDLGDLASITRTMPGKYDEDLKLDYFMEKVEKEFPEHIVRISEDDYIRKACYYIKYLSPDTVRKIVEVQTRLLDRRDKLIEENSTVSWQRIFNEDTKVTVTDWVKVKKELEPLEKETDKIMDELDTEEKKRKTQEKTRETKERNKREKGEYKSPDL